MNLKDESITQIDSRDRRIDSIFIQFDWSFLIMHFHSILAQYFSSTSYRNVKKSSLLVGWRERELTIHLNNTKFFGLFNKKYFHDQ